MKLSAQIVTFSAQRLPMVQRLDPIFPSGELLFPRYDQLSVKHRRNNVNAWHRLFNLVRPQLNNNTSHTCQHHTTPYLSITQPHTFAALIWLSTTTHNLTFSISEISSNNSKKLSLLANNWNTSGLFSHTRLMQFPACRATRSAGKTLALISHRKKK